MPDEDPVVIPRKGNLEPLLLEIHQTVKATHDIVLDLQVRQKVMDERQREIRKDFDESGASDPKGSFGTGYQKG